MQICVKYHVFSELVNEHERPVKVTSVTEHFRSNPAALPD